MAEDGSQSNSAARLVAIIEFLASRPTETFSVSEIARRVGQNKSTAYSLVRTLHGAGWVFRSPVNLRYGIGPILTVLGEAAAQAMPEVSLARPVIDRLAAEFHRECVLSTVVGDEIVVTHTTGPAQLGQPWSRPGTRVVYAPPFGTVFVAWQDEAAQKEWYERGSVVSPQRFDELTADLEAIRKRGFVATAANPAAGQWEQLIQDVGENPTVADLRRLSERRVAILSPVDYLVGADETVSTIDIGQMMAPIFDGGVPRWALTVNGINQEMDLATIMEKGRRIRGACDEVSEAITQLR